MTRNHFIPDEILSLYYRDNLYRLLCEAREARAADAEANAFIPPAPVGIPQAYKPNVYKGIAAALYKQKEELMKVHLRSLLKLEYRQHTQSELQTIVSKEIGRVNREFYEEVCQAARLYGPRKRSSN